MSDSKYSVQEAGHANAEVKGQDLCKLEIKMGKFVEANCHEHPQKIPKS